MLSMLWEDKCKTEILLRIQNLISLKGFRIYEQFFYSSNCPEPVQQLHQYNGTNEKGEQMEKE